jgi:hypothetical protein
MQTQASCIPCLLAGWEYYSWKQRNQNARHPNVQAMQGSMQFQAMNTLDGQENTKHKTIPKKKTNNWSRQIK